MAFRNTSSAESWDKIYEAFEQVNFTSFDFDSIKQSLIDYVRIYYSETFNDMIQSSEFIALLEIFAYIAEQLAYRVDMVSHENFISTAQRKQSILRMAKLISYKATRNIPARGMVKFTSISTTERIVDSRGIDLSGLAINWNDPNNANWKEQFILVMNHVLTSRLGQSQKSFAVGDVIMDLYTLNASADSFTNGVHSFTASTGLDSFPMELVPADLDTNGPFEREPDTNTPMTIFYANDGVGDGSDYTGFLGYVKQGSLTRIDYNILERLPNRRIEFLPNNVNHIDVWVQEINSSGAIVNRWTQVETVAEQNLIFNNDRSTRKKFEVDTLENDQIAIVFGDGDFSDAPIGLHRFWMRQSANRAVVIPKNKIANEVMTFTYSSSTGNTETCTVTFSLTSTLQNGSASETIEHVRSAAPATYYSQNRMVNGQDYNTYLLRDPTILRLKTINRTFAGQPKYIDWNDASGAYENVKLFGDDLTMRYSLSMDTENTSLSGQALIDSVIEPLLNTSGVITAMLHVSATDPATIGVVSSPRRSFIEDNRAGLFKSTNTSFVKLIDGSIPDGSLKEKTAMQGLIDRHWYGEALEYVEVTGSQVWAKIPDPNLYPKDDSKIYAASVPRTIDGVNKFPPGDVGSGLQPIAEQDYFGLRWNRYMVGVGNGAITVFNAPQGSPLNGVETWTIEIGADNSTFVVRSNLRGTFSTGSVGDTYNITPTGYQSPVSFFMITAGSIQFEPGDAFIIDVVNGIPVTRSALSHGDGYNSSNGVTIKNVTDLVSTSQYKYLAVKTVGVGTNWAALGASSNTPSVGEVFICTGVTGVGTGTVSEQIPGTINLNGWWEILSYSQLPHYAGGQVTDGDELLYSTSNSNPSLKQHSWLIFVRKIRQQPTNNVIGYEVHHRNLSLSVNSPSTKFWFNEVDQILDSDTKKPVFDSIKILRSNLDSQGNVLGKSQQYDVVGAVKDNTGVINFNELQIVPTDLLQEDSSGDLVPDRLLQFETFSAGSYEYFELTNPTVTLDPVINSALWNSASTSTYSTGAFIDDTITYGRRPRMPQIGSTDSGLDFMWQHWAPYTNIIDPSVTNIHDAFILTQGYYDSVISYLRGLSDTAPTAPTPLDLRNSYSYLLQNKMLSDTLVLHPGKLRLLFGTLAEPQFRAKFKVVRAPGASLTNERVKEELLTVINKYFDIANWDFGETFYATELLAMMHQRLPTEIASVVIVPLYSTNSFGDMFTVTCGFDEILQSAAQLTDIEIVDALTPTTIRQIK
jgi:hypothetical protein